MYGKEAAAEFLRSYYGGVGLLEYSESADEIRFRVPTPLRDAQTAAFRSQATALNELAVSHRLSLLIGRGKYGLPEDFAFAIKSVETAVRDGEGKDACDVSLRFEVLARRHDTMTALRSTLVTEHGVEARTTTTTFNVLTPSLANFVRRARQFADFADVRMSRDESYLSALADNHYRYFPSEADRLSDGRRVDHVPALILIDIALSIGRMARQEAADSNLSAEFLNYTDPRQPFDILRRSEDGALEFVQDGRSVAVVSIGECPAP